MEEDEGVFISVDEVGAEVERHGLALFAGEGWQGHSEGRILVCAKDTKLYIICSSILNRKKLDGGGGGGEGSGMSLLVGS